MMQKYTEANRTLITFGSNVGKFGSGAFVYQFINLCSNLRNRRKFPMNVENQRGKYYISFGNILKNKMGC